MMKKILLYGLCVNWGIAFGMPTQKVLEEFLKAQEENVEVKRVSVDAEGGCCIPREIILKNEAAEKAFAEFTRSNEEPMEFHMESARVCSKDLTDEERRVRFENYSKEATEEETCVLSEWGVGVLRIVDFDSIVDGLDDETQKVLARRLIKKENQEALLAALNAWIDGLNIRDCHYLSVFDSHGERVWGCSGYTLSSDVVRTFRESLKNVLKRGFRCKTAREIWVLSLILLKDLRWVISDWGCSYNSGAIEFQFFKNENGNVQSLCHELNHALHDRLGISGCHSIIGNFDSRFEQGLFSFLEGKVECKVPSGLFSMLFRESGNMLDSEEVISENFLRKAQVVLLWDGFEELWNIIGFANVADCVYVNRMSDMNYMMPWLGFFHGQANRITEMFDQNQVVCPPDLYRWLQKVEQKMVESVSDLCPTSEAWKVWLKLQNREEGVGYITMVDKTLEELRKLSEEVLLLEEDSSGL